MNRFFAITLLILVIFCNSSNASIINVFKDISENIKDKISDIISANKDKDEIKKDQIELKTEKKNDTTEISYLVSYPPPDVEVFKTRPVDISVVYPTIVENNGVYNVSNITVFEDFGDTVLESMILAQKKALDIAFSNIIIKKNIQHLRFTIAEAVACLSGAYVENEVFQENRYFGNFKMEFSSECIEKEIDGKLSTFLMSGFGNDGVPYRNMKVYIPLKDKTTWFDIEKRLFFSTIDHKVIAFTNRAVIAELKAPRNSSADFNISQRINAQGLALYMENDKLCLKIMDEESRNVDIR